MSRWLLPESIADVLPSEARGVENLRRRLLDLYRAHGFELVMPPMLEYLDSLLTGSGQDLNLKTETAEGYQKIISNLLKSIEPLLTNLAKDADTKEYIYWPDRKIKIDSYRKKLYAIASGN